MKKSKSPYYGFRFPASVISCAVRWYHRFNLSLRDIEELLLERGVSVTYESVRNRCERFVGQFSRCTKAVRGKVISTCHIDEVFVKLRGEPYVLWRAVDEHGTECCCKNGVTRQPPNASSGRYALTPGAPKDCHRSAE